MLEALGMAELSAGDLWVVFLAAAFVLVVFGFAGDLILGQHGFGVIGNGAILLAGPIAALYYECTWLRYGNHPDLNTTFTLSISLAAAFLFGMSLAKSRVLP
ncbi:MAG: hypothetical protein KGM42_12770 [Hyphomicrobiales bacterium]|nr:hypothetical protein [Hyphomicrobiales bacterium]